MRTFEAGNRVAKCPRFTFLLFVAIYGLNCSQTGRPEKGNVKLKTATKCVHLKLSCWSHGEILSFSFLTRPGAQAVYRFVQGARETTICCS